MSVIARTAGIGRTTEELQWDMNYLLQLWHAVEDAAKMQSGAYLIYQESSLVIRAIRDYFHQEIGELLIDTEAIYEQAQQFMSHVMPANVNRVKLYKDDVPLFSRFQIEHQIETAYARQVPLPSGGSIVIDHTEALVAVDVNSARATKGGDIETTAFNTNLEAAGRDRAPACAFATWAASSSSTSSTWRTRRTSATSRTACAMRSSTTARACSSARSRASASWSCRASACVPRSPNPRTSPARAATASATSAAPNRPRCTSSGSSRRKR